MGVTYLQGGDTYQKLDHPIWAGQTFRPSESFTLQWIDLNLKLSGRRPEARVTVWHAGVDHLPSGVLLSPSSYWLVNQPLIHRDWLWFEPWGKTLNENHYWLEQPPGSPPDVSLHNGAVTIVNTGETAQWLANMISVYDVPLVDAYGKHLYFHHCSPISLGHPVNHWHSYTFKTEKNGDLWTLEGIISNGTQWPPWDSSCGVTPLGSCFYCGQGPQVFDFTEWWIRCRTCLELDPDPTGWSLIDFHLRIEDTEAAPGGTLQNNFCGISREPHTPVPFDDYNVLPSGYSLPNRLYRVRFKMKEVLLEAESYYFIRVCVFTTLLDSPHYWQYDKGNASYPGGIRLSSDDGGASWDKHFDDDHLFAAFGTPQSPAPPPEPPIAHWAILDVVQTVTLTGYKIVATTNVPVHLSMFWTNQEPEKHKRTSIVRGVATPAAVAFCFVVWNQNEQDEPGDTLFHTFVKEPWPVCETRWYTFRALVNKDWSPSVGPIFTKHRAYVPPPPTCLEFIPDRHVEVTSVDGRCGQHTAPLTWDECRNGPGSTSDDDDSYGTIGMRAYSALNTWWYMYRGLFLFDTSVIPFGSIIVSAKLALYLRLKKDDLNCNPAYAIYTSNPASNNDLINADYATLGDTALTNLIEYADIVNDAMNEFIFKPSGLLSIAPADITKLGLRESYYDAPGIPPPWSSVKETSFSVRFSDIGGSTRPLFTVCFIPP